MKPKIELTAEQEKEIIDFYLEPHSMTETCTHFNFKSSCRVLRILSDHNIPVHNRDVRVQLADKQRRATCLAKYGVEVISQASEIKTKVEETCLERFGCARPLASEEVKKKRKQNNLSKYGVENISQLAETKEKVKQTCLERYGGIGFASTELSDKQKLVCLEKYGVVHPQSLAETKNKRKQTCLDRFGYDSVFKIPEVKNQIRTTNMEKYGVEFATQLEEVQAKTKQTCLDKYGYEYPMQVPDIQEKAKQANLRAWGVENVFQAAEIKAKSKQTNIVKYGVPYYTQTNTYHKNKVSKYYINDVSFDSLPELAVWVYCQDNNISISRLPVKLEYAYKDKMHYYFPDFEIDGKLVEIKGDCFFAEDGTACCPFDHSLDERYEAKRQCGLENGVEFWTSKDYNTMLTYFNDNYDKSDFLLKGDLSDENLA